MNQSINIPESELIQMIFNLETDNFSAEISQMSETEAQQIIDLFKLWGVYEFDEMCVLFALNQLRGVTNAISYFPIPTFE